MASLVNTSGTAEIGQRESGADRCHILDPWIPGEALTSAMAAKRAGKSPRAIQNWAEAYGIGRKIVGQWHISRVALEMLLESNERALSRYLSGNREDPIVTEYFARLNVPLPKK